MSGRNLLPGAEGVNAGYAFLCISVSRGRVSANAIDAVHAYTFGGATSWAASAYHQVSGSC